MPCFPFGRFALRRKPAPDTGIPRSPLAPRSPGGSPHSTDWGSTLGSPETQAPQSLATSPFSRGTTWDSHTFLSKPVSPAPLVGSRPIGIGGMRVCRLIAGAQSEFEVTDIMLGKGATATVVLGRARHAACSPRCGNVALKRLPYTTATTTTATMMTTAESASTSDGDDTLCLPYPPELARQACEATVLAALKHKNIVQYIGTAVDDTGTAYLVLEYVPGGSLQSRMFPDSRRKRHMVQLPARSVERYARHVLEGLAYLHGKGFVHGDVKPANILIDNRTDTAKLTDFGLACMTASVMPVVTRHPHPGGGSPFDSTATASAKMAVSSVETPDGWQTPGTPWYMASEQLLGSTPRQSRPADIWAFGITFLEAATGQRAWQQCESVFDLLLSVGEGGPDVSAAVPEQLREMLLSCFRPCPGDRPSAAQLLRSALFSSPASLEDVAQPPGQQQWLSVSHIPPSIPTTFGRQSTAGSSHSALVLEDSESSMALTSEESNVSSFLPGVLPPTAY